MTSLNTQMTDRGFIVTDKSNTLVATINYRCDTSYGYWQVFLEKVLCNTLTFCKTPVMEFNSKEAAEYWVLSAYCEAHN
jgi:hypothetical protein